MCVVLRVWAVLQRRVRCAWGAWCAMPRAQCVECMGGTARGVPKAQCALAQGWAGLQLGAGGVDTAPWLEPPPKKKGLIDGPQNPTETDPQASEVTQTQNSAKNENGIFGISASRGFRKNIICHGKKN